MTTAGHRLPIVFHGSGSEYFRIWVVNLLLTLVTIGLYYPWAKVRRLRYFYGNTFVGEHALDFHGDPKLMLRGFLLAALMGIVYSVAGKVSPVAGLVAFLVLAVLFPALFWTSQRFRLANTSWRGLRFRFSGTLGGAYRAMLPLFLPGLLFLLTVVFALDDDTTPEARSRAGMHMLWVMPIVFLAFPFVFWLMKRYQHGHFVFGQVETRLRTGAGSFYLLAVKALGVWAALVVGFMLAAVAVLLLWHGTSASDRPSRGVFVTLGIVVFYIVFLSFMVPWTTTRLQNLVWGRTDADGVRFESDLRVWRYFGLALKNLLLMIVTLGLYAPFARIAVARMRLQAIAIHSALDPDALVASHPDPSGIGATGDAAGDLFGFDIGW